MLDITLPSHFVGEYWGNYSNIVIEKWQTLFFRKQTNKTKNQRVVLKENNKTNELFRSF